MVLESIDDVGYRTGGETGKRHFCKHFKSNQVTFIVILLYTVEIVHGIKLENNRINDANFTDEANPNSAAVAKI